MLHKNGPDIACQTRNLNILYAFSSRFSSAGSAR